MWLASLGDRGIVASALVSRVSFPGGSQFPIWEDTQVGTQGEGPRLSTIREH